MGRESSPRPAPRPVRIPLARRSLSSSRRSPRERKRERQVHGLTPHTAHELVLGRASWTRRCRTRTRPSFERCGRKPRHGDSCIPCSRSATPPGLPQGRSQPAGHSRLVRLVVPTPRRPSAVEAGRISWRPSPACRPTPTAQPGSRDVVSPDRCHGESVSIDRHYRARGEISDVPPPCPRRPPASREERQHQRRRPHERPQRARRRLMALSLRLPSTSTHLHFGRTPLQSTWHPPPGRCRRHPHADTADRPSPAPNAPPRTPPPASARGAQNDAPMSCQGAVGDGAGKPVMGHSRCEGRLLSGQAVSPRGWERRVGRSFAGQPGGVLAFRGPDSPLRSWRYAAGRWRYTWRAT